jgi:hypothetical protein
MIRILLLLAAALPAWAEGHKPPAEPRLEPEKETGRRPLNLRLDNPSSFATVAPPEKDQPKGLPTLGGDARRIGTPAVAGTRSEGGPYPPDTNPNR